VDIDGLCQSAAHANQSADGQVIRHTPDSWPQFMGQQLST